MAFVVFFMAVLIGIVTLSTVLISKHIKDTERTAAPFNQVVQDAAVKVVPETLEFEMVVAEGVKDAVQAVKGYERIQSGYDTMPKYIVCYRNREMYIMAASYSSRKEIRIDPDNILHFTMDQVEKIKIGAGGKILIFFKDSKQFFAMEVSKVKIAPQIEAYDNFMSYIKAFAS